MIEIPGMNDNLAATALPITNNAAAGGVGGIMNESQPQIASRFVYVLTPHPFALAADAMHASHATGRRFIKDDALTIAPGRHPKPNLICPLCAPVAISPLCHH